jgi:transcriptional regulator with XRE-family HTH domain
MLYHVRMDVQSGVPGFGRALLQAIRDASMTQARLADSLNVDPGQVSRWVNDRTTPTPDTVRRIEAALNADLSAALLSITPKYDLYVAAPITGVRKGEVADHHAAVARVVSSTKLHVDSVYWPGESIADFSDLIAPDIATEKNMEAMAHCKALLYLQFAEIVQPSGALIELGIALGRRLRTTIICGQDLRQAFMLDGFGAVAASVSWLPKARIYSVRSVDDACVLIDRNGKQLLGLE